MRAATYSRVIAVSSKAGLYAAALVSLLGRPAWAEDVPVLTLAGPQGPMAELAAPAPRLSLTLGNPVVAPGAGPHDALDLGLQWRQPVLSGRHVDITAWRRVTSAPDALTLIRQREPVYGARVEMKLNPKRRGLLADRGFIGLQLDSGARITLRRKDGNPTLYYRSQF